jgi:hypothetical protein
MLLTYINVGFPELRGFNEYKSGAKRFIESQTKMAVFWVVALYSLVEE